MGPNRSIGAPADPMGTERGTGGLTDTPARPFGTPFFSRVGSLLVAAVGLLASAMLAVDYVGTAPVFCSDAGGCEAIKRTVFASFVGIPTPFFGLAGFLAIGVASLVPGQIARTAQMGLAAVAGLVGLSLFGIQVKLGHFCPFCCVADASGVLSALAASFCLWGPRYGGPSVVLAIVGALVLAAAGAVPVVFGMRMTPGIPTVIREELAGTPAHQVTVVDFVDFECPFCRMTNTVLEPLLLLHKDRIRLVRKQVPLRIHPHARDAARAACCGESLGAGEAMASALFRTDETKLTPEGCESIAERLGLSLPAYRACVADPKTDARIDADRDEFKAARGFALPTLWIGDVEVVGAVSGDSLTKTLNQALARVGG